MAQAMWPLTFPYNLLIAGFSVTRNLSTHLAVPVHLVTKNSIICQPQDAVPSESLQGVAKTPTDTEEH